MCGSGQRAIGKKRYKGKKRNSTLLCKLALVHLKFLIYTFFLSELEISSGSIFCHFLAWMHRELKFAINSYDFSLLQILSNKKKKKNAVMTFTTQDQEWSQSNSCLKLNRYQKEVKRGRERQVVGNLKPYSWDRFQLLCSNFDLFSQKIKNK